MFQANLIQTLLKGIDPIQSKNIHLRPGQLFQGQIMKLYPDHMATLKLGGITVTARLEAPLLVGERYWFEVQPGGGLPNLKVIEQTKTAENAHKSLLGKLGLKFSKAYEQLLMRLIKNDVPFTKDHMIKGGELLKSLGNISTKDVGVIETLIHKNSVRCHFQWQRLFMF